MKPAIVGEPAYTLTAPHVRYGTPSSEGARLRVAAVWLIPAVVPKKVAEENTQKLSHLDFCDYVSAYGGFPIGQEGQVGLDFMWIIRAPLVPSYVAQLLLAGGG